MTVCGIEMGGTKVLVGFGSGPDDLTLAKRIPTTTPDAVFATIADAIADQEFAAIGIASFGPIDPDQGSAGYGHITTTPKPGWAHTDVLARLRALTAAPLFFDTDVNGAALAELRWGAGQGLNSLAYVTVGTGIGAGLIINGAPVHGMIHPEAGHVLVRRDPARDPFAGICPYHGDCLEGLASGPAIAARVGAPAETLPSDHPVWALVADYLGQLCMSLALVASPQRIVIGGGVGLAPGLLPKVRVAARHYLAGYLVHQNLRGDMAEFIQAPALGDKAGLLGAIALAANASAS
jgi:fructokinase